jgi:hypothetical protein
MLAVPEMHWFGQYVRRTFQIRARAAKVAMAGKTSADVR